MIFLGLLLSLFHQTTGQQVNSTQNVTPVILVPGICGSQVDGWYKKSVTPHVYCTKDSKTWTTLWLCLECMLPAVINCWVDTFKLNTTDIYNLKNTNGVQTKVNDFGYTNGIGYLDKNRFVVQFEKMIQGLETRLGMKRGINIRGAPYDYRYSPNTMVGKQYMIRLKFLVEETYELNDDTPVMIVAHSMGNPYMVNFLSSMEQKWKDKYIKGYVSFAGVFGGASKAIRSIISGETEGLPEIIVDPLTMREFERTSPSVYWLFPTPQVMKDLPLVMANGRNYTASQYRQLLEDTKVDKGAELYDYIQDVPLFLPDLGVDVYCMHGINQTTPLQFRYKEGTFPDKYPTTINGNGDGTVNLPSLQLCKQFKRLKHYQAVSGFLATHLEILQRDDVIDFLSELLAGKHEQQLDI